MNKKDIEANNKLIAEFMGGKYDKDTSFPIHPSDIWLPFHGVVNHTTIESGMGRILKYHISWDWLMPVVEKIEESGYQVNIYDEICHIVSTGRGGYDMKHGLDTKLNSVYESVAYLLNHEKLC